MIRKIFIAAMLAGTIGSIATPASAVTYVRIAPPEPRAESVPEHRRGYTWSAGHWEWKNRHHVWVSGKWVKDKRGHHYSQPTWSQHSDGRWYMTQGNWKRGDSDHDGVRNGQDRAPNNPYRN